MRLLPHAALTLALALGAACANPVHAAAVAALGDEKPGVPTGETHRPGQPCSVCHGGDGPGPDFAIGGTIYETRGVDKALGEVIVTLTDAKGETRTPVSNAVGNFYLRAGDWSPTFPLFASLSYKDGSTANMMTRIGGNISCAYCHYGADGEPSHMPPVFLRELKK